MKIDSTNLSTMKGNVSFNGPTEKLGQRETFLDEKTLEEFKIQKKASKLCLLTVICHVCQKQRKGRCGWECRTKRTQFFVLLHPWQGLGSEQCDEWHQQRRPKQRHKQLDQNRQCDSDHGKRWENRRFERDGNGSTSKEQQIDDQHGEKQSA